MRKDSLIVITGAAGLVGQNLVAELRNQGFTRIIALDKHQGNLEILKKLHPEVQCFCADLAMQGYWQEAFRGAERLFLLQAQITGDEFPLFQRNTLDSTANVLQAAKKHEIPFVVFVSSSVVHSVADDNYTRSKKAQEEQMRASGLACCVVRPTLMFGWFDPKHLGWLSRFMEKIPVFPIPGHGEYLRQPLYVKDFCKVLVWCAKHAPAGKNYDIVGEEEISYIDIIKKIKQVKSLETFIVRIPVPFFRFLLKVYALVCKNPPFVADQLDALMAGDFFRGDSFELFDVKPTPFVEAIQETFTHPEYSHVILER